MPSEAPVVRFEAVDRTFRTTSGRVRALRGITASFPARSIVAVAGPSGSGKSSLLRLIAGMDVPTAGSVVVAGRSVERASARARRRLRRDTVGYVFQRPSDNFVPHLTVAEHLARVADPHDVREILEALGIAHRADHLPLQLSGGEQQRAAFAQAFVGGAQVVVADEPTAELDDASSVAVLSGIRAMRDRGVTLIIATHDDAVVRVADTVLRLDHGRVLDPVRARSGPAVEVTRGWDPPSDGARALRVRGLVKTFTRADERVHAVDGVSFEVREGEFVGLIGRSGSGKTTLLGLVAAWEGADGGTIERSDEAPNGEAPAWSDVAVVPQTLGLMDELTVRENVAYPAKLSGAPDAHTERVTALLDALGLTALAERRPHETSVGEQQRAAVARALLLRPRLLVADEPTCHQDRGWTDRVVAAIREACDEGTACLMATHDPASRRFLDRALVMHEGRLEPTDA
ncbi:MAG TPA: ATP-binding cassette domain-containing protein [Actinomycetota bacterium]|nr:ATP-binding cassette domain-containing protein [Actinomycetota bacterium]